MTWKTLFCSLVALSLTSVSAEAKSHKIEKITVGACAGGDLAHSAHLIMTFTTQDKVLGQTFIRIFVDGRGARQVLVADAYNLLCLRGIYSEGEVHKIHIEPLFETPNENIKPHYIPKWDGSSGGIVYAESYNLDFTASPNSVIKLEMTEKNTFKNRIPIRDEDEARTSETLVIYQCRNTNYWNQDWCETNWPAVPPPPPPEVVIAAEYNEYRTRAQEMLRILGKNSLLHLYLMSPAVFNSVPASIRRDVEEGIPSPEAIAWANATLSQVMVPEVGRMCSISVDIGLSAVITFVADFILPRFVTGILSFIANLLIGRAEDRIKQDAVNSLCTHYRRMTYESIPR